MLKSLLCLPSFCCRLIYAADQSFKIMCTKSQHCLQLVVWNPQQFNGSVILVGSIILWCHIHWLWLMWYNSEPEGCQCLLIDGCCGVRCLHAADTFYVHLSLHDHWMFDHRCEDTMVTVLFVFVPKWNLSIIKMQSLYLKDGHLLANREVPEFLWAEDFYHASA